MRWWLFILIGFVAYLFFLTIDFPAHYATDWLEKNNSAINIHGDSGSIWKGTADEVSYNHTSLGAIKWIIAPLSLSLGKVKYRFELAGPRQNLTGYAAISMLTGQYTLSGLQGSIRAETIPSLINQAYVQVSGDVDVDIELLGFSQQRIISALGNIRWLDATAQSPINIELGDLQFKLFSDASTVRTTVKDLAGPLKVDGELVLSPDMTYRIQGKVIPGPSTDTGMVNLLRSMGRAGTEGSTLIDFTGKL